MCDRFVVQLDFCICLHKNVSIHVYKKPDYKAELPTKRITYLPQHSFPKEAFFSKSELAWLISGNTAVLVPLSERMANSLGGNLMLYHCMVGKQTHSIAIYYRFRFH
jgi:hypothetical protein